MSLKVEALGDALLLTVHQPATRNAIDRELARSIGEAARCAADDPKVRGVVITGVGTAFLSGANLNMLSELSKRADGSDDVLAMFDDLSACERCDVPFIAAVQGDVLGGGSEFLLLCDLAFMEEHAALAFLHAKMGLAPAWGGMVRLIERIGPIEASRLLFTAEKISADEARRLGLVNEVVPRGTSKDRALALITRMAARTSRAAVAAMKRTMREAREAARGAAIERERAVFRGLWGGADHRAAMSAFLAKK